MRSCSYVFYCSKICYHYINFFYCSKKIQETKKKKKKKTLTSLGTSVILMTGRILVSPC